MENDDWINGGNIVIDWIKMRSNLWDDPRVSRIMDITNAANAAVVGALYWLWTTGDQHSEDGVLTGFSLKAIDRKVGIEGFGDALCEVGWLTNSNNFLQICNFNEHNGAIAKHRAVDAKRKLLSRTWGGINPTSTYEEDAPSKKMSAKCPENVQKISDTFRTKRGHFSDKTEGVLIKSKNNPPIVPPPAGFDDFWAVYPNRKARLTAERAWAKIRPDAGLRALILEAVSKQSRSDNWIKDNGIYIPHAATWLNGQRWKDEGPQIRMAYENKVAL